MSLNLLHNFALPRCVLPSSQVRQAQLHVFADASERAYAAVVYTRITDDQGNVACHILTSKTRVAPVKTVSLPRLELCAAHLAAKLIKTLLEVLTDTKFSSPQVFAWTDSKTVLQWLSRLPRSWTTFVANRVADIQDTLPKQNWRHVPTKTNPADLGSRGTIADQLISSPLWWNGPAWLSKEPDEWPAECALPEKVPETRGKGTIDDQQPSTDVQSALGTARSDNNVLLPLSERISTLRTFLRVVAHVMRAKKRFKKLPAPHGPPSFNESEEAKFAIVAELQRNAFPDEYSALQKKQPLNPKSSLLNLCPFFDAEFDVIRVGGRLSQSDYSDNKKFPVILDKFSSLTMLVVRHFHEATLHGGGQLVLNALREEFWIVRGKVQSVES